MKGIVLAGGEGTRLYPLTIVTSKQLLSVYDKPMIYYPLSTLMLAGIKDILIITTPRDLANFQDLLGNGFKYGINLSYKVQPYPGGLAQAFIIGEQFIGDDNCAMILGDNLFHGINLTNCLKNAINNKEGATIFSRYVDTPKRFGVIEFDKYNNAVSIEEKPKIPKSNYAVTGLYFYDNKVVEYAKTLKPSSRYELEITDLNKIYLEQGNLNVVPLECGVDWFDIGTIDSLLDASDYVKLTEIRRGSKIACLEEIAYLNGWISKELLIKSAYECGKSSYGQYLYNVVQKF